MTARAEPFHTRPHRRREDERHEEQRDQYLQLPERKRADDDGKRDESGDQPFFCDSHHLCNGVRGD
jgi:hypothetical protein